MIRLADLASRALSPALSGAAHAAVLAALVFYAPVSPDAAGAPGLALDVSLVDEGELAPAPASLSLPETLPVETPAEPQALPSELQPPEPDRQALLQAEQMPPAPEALPESLPDALPEPLAELPPVPPLQFAAPAPKPEVAKPEPPKVASPKIEPRKVEPPKSAAAPKASPPKAAVRPQPITGSGTQGSQAGTGRASVPGQNGTSLAYASRVRAVLQARANALGIEDHEGAVGLSFVIGGSGRIESHAITRSSGSASVDRMIRGMMASVSFPAPPGGRFSGTVTIRIQ